MTPPLDDIVINKIPPTPKLAETLAAFHQRNAPSPVSPAKSSTVTVTVPIPTKCTVRTAEGSCLLTVVQGNATDDLSPGDSIRIDHPHESHDYKISSDLSEKQFFLTEVFHRSPDYNRHRYCYRHHQHEDDVIPWMNDDQVFPNPQTRLWKLIPKDKDKRLEWRIRYDDGNVPWKTQYTDCDSASNLDTHTHTCFGVKMKWSQIESLCREEDALHYNNLDNAVHQQRLHYFEKVPLQEIIVSTYNSVCQWHPIGTYIDSVKWAKLARKMKFLSSLKNSNHQVDMAFFHHSCDRKLSIKQFTSVLQDMAALRYSFPHYNSTVSAPKYNYVYWRKKGEAIFSRIYYTHYITTINKGSSSQHVVDNSCNTATS